MARVRALQESTRESRTAHGATLYGELMEFIDVMDSFGIDARTAIPVISPRSALALAVGSRGVARET